MIAGETLDMIRIVADGMGALRSKMVFIGGASTCLLIDDPAADHIRPTIDVDCAIETTSRADFSRIEIELCRLGFSHVMEPGAPICRWRYKGILVDVMPDHHEILGFASIWYKEGVANAQFVDIPNGPLVRCFTPAYFIASKIEAFKARGTDFRTSHDIEDIVFVLDGRLNLADIKFASQHAIEYLQEHFAEFLAQQEFHEAVHGHLLPGHGSLERANRIIEFLKDFAQSKN